MKRRAWWPTVSHDCELTLTLWGLGVAGELEHRGDTRAVLVHLVVGPLTVTVRAQFG